MSPAGADTSVSRLLSVIRSSKRSRGITTSEQAGIKTFVRNIDIICQCQQDQQS